MPGGFAVRRRRKMRRSFGMTISYPVGQSEEFCSSRVPYEHKMFDDFLFVRDTLGAGDTFGGNSIRAGRAQE